MNDVNLTPIHICQAEREKLAILAQTNSTTYFVLVSEYKIAEKAQLSIMKQSNPTSAFTVTKKISGKVLPFYEKKKIHLPLHSMEKEVS